MRIRLGFGLIVAGASILAGCYEPPPMRVEGNLSVRGEELGNWELDPGICAGGFYKGIDVSSADGERCVRFIDDPELGPIVVAFIPGTLDGFVAAPEERPRLFSAQFLKPTRYVTGKQRTCLTLSGRLGSGAGPVCAPHERAALYRVTAHDPGDGAARRSGPM